MPSISLVCQVCPISVSSVSHQCVKCVTSMCQVFPISVSRVSLLCAKCPISVPSVPSVCEVSHQIAKCPISVRSVPSDYQVSHQSVKCLFSVPSVLSECEVSLQCAKCPINVPNVSSMSQHCLSLSGHRAPTCVIACIMCYKQLSVIYICLGFAYVFKTYRNIHTQKVPQCANKKMFLLSYEDIYKLCPCYISNKILQLLFFIF